MQLLQERARLDAERVDERLATQPIRLERLRLSARPVEREHQLAAEALPQRMLADERLEIADELAVTAEGELGLCALLLEREPELLQPTDLALCERLVRKLRQRLAAPERKRVAQEPRPA